MAFVNAFYSTGNLPNALQVIPPETPPDKVRSAFELLDSQLSGNLAKRRGIRPIQGFAEKGQDQIIQPTAPVLTDAYDELHTHRICFGYGTSPQRLLKMMNRSTAQGNQEAAEEEGLMPFLTWVRGIINWIIQVMMGYPEYEFVFDLNREQDIVKQQTADCGYVAAAIKNREEVREALDLDPAEEENASKLGVMGPTGWIGLDTEPPTPPPPPGPGGAPGEPIPRGSRKPPQTVQTVNGAGGKKVLKLVLSAAPEYAAHTY
jgi:hypothetical protein